MLREIEIDGHVDAGQVRSALRTGFFLVRRTVPESLLDDAYDLLTAFFALSAAEKADCVVPGSNGQSGYTPSGIETAEKARVPDFKELFHWGTRLPAGHPLLRRYPARYPEPLYPDRLVPGIGKVLQELHARTLEFQHRVVGAIAEALGATPSYFAEMLEDGPVVNRASWYPPMDRAPSPGQMWAVEHQDFDLITALHRATASGLEVQDETGEWIGVDASGDHSVVNVGMVLERLTNGLARAAVHRVAARPGQTGGRLSIVQFCHPAPWTVLTPLTGGSGHPAPRYPTLTADDVFQRTMFRINRLEPPKERVS
jgi:isopenicillin N synthase-like dioxygenase